MSSDRGFCTVFEELLFFDGKATFGKVDDARAFCAAEIPGGKQHRFHNLHDAAAWIQKNWPDFDLESELSGDLARLALKPVLLT